MRVAIDFQAEGLLDGASDRESRLELLQSLEQEGFSLEELREAAAQEQGIMNNEVLPSLPNRNFAVFSFLQLPYFI